jgi:hypothetical protein
MREKKHAKGAWPAQKVREKQKVLMKVTQKVL